MKKTILFLCALFLMFSSNIFAQEFDLYTYKANIISVYDGDTVTADIDLGFNISVIQKLRLNRIDAPEVRGSERPEGLLSRDTLRELVLNKEVYIKTLKDKRGKYGRYIVEIFRDGVNINDWLVLNGFAEYATYN